MDSSSAARASENRLRLALDAAGGVGTWTWDPCTGAFEADACLWQLHGAAPGPKPSLDQLLATVTPEDRPGLGEALARAGAGDGPLQVEYRLGGEDAATRWILMRGDPRALPDGTTLVLGIALDVSEQRRAERALRESDARYEAITNSIDQMIWSTRPDGYHDYFNRRWYEFTGVPEHSTDGSAWSEMFHPDDRGRTRERWDQSLATGEPYHIEYRLRHRSGRYRWVIGRAQCVRDRDGAITRWYGTCTDIHDLKEAEEARELIARELSHRIKNVFAVLSSLVMLPARQRPELLPYAAEVQARIEALAIAHEYVRPHSAESGPPASPKTVLGLLRMLTQAYQTETRPRITIGGDDVGVGNQAANALALVVHELSTNAVKHGALSRDAGSVTIACAAAGTEYSIRWTERGGPAVAGAPSHRGFGSILSERVVTAQLEAAIERDWAPAGLDLSIRIPTDRLADADTAPPNLEAP